MQLLVITKLTKRSLTSKDCLWKLMLNIRLPLLCCNPPDYWRMLLGGWRKGYGDNCHKNRTVLPEIKNHRIAVGGTGSFITSYVLCRSQCQVWGFEWSVSLQRRLVFWVFFCVCVCFFFSSQYIAKQLLSLISQIYPEFTMQSLLLAIGNDLFSQFWPSFQKAECQIITVYLVFCCQKIWSSIKILLIDSESQRK